MLYTLAAACISARAHAAVGMEEQPDFSTFIMQTQLPQLASFLIAMKNCQKLSTHASKKEATSFNESREEVPNEYAKCSSSPTSGIFTL